ncbi:MAG: class I SAM-dependent methyltransferase [Bacillota bacterium]
MSHAVSILVTTSIRPRRAERLQAEEISRTLGLPYVSRSRESLEALRRKSGAEAVVVVSRNRVGLVFAGREFFFHPGLGKVRIRRIEAGKTDQMIQAMGLKAGDSVLDCTLGLGADALVASHVVGAGGRVVGLEVVPVVAMLVRCGLENYAGGGPPAEAMRRVEVVTADHREYLQALENDSFDVVYFDPMFRVPRHASSAMEPLRPLADARALDPESVGEAVRVARRRVVLKERAGSPEFERLGFRRITGGRYSPVAYGIIAKDGDEA